MPDLWENIKALVGAQRNAMSQFSNPSAYSRVGRIPIHMTETSPTSGSSGAYTPFSLDNPIKGAIMVNYPRGEMQNNPGDIADTLRHELVHAALRGVHLPFNYEKAGFQSVPSDFPLESGSKVARARAMRESAGPQNDYNWKYWNAAGFPSQEIPAYMSIYDPSVMMDPGSGIHSVTQQQHDQYMSDFYKYLQSRGHGDVANRVQQIIQGRESQVFSDAPYTPKADVPSKEPMYYTRGHGRHHQSQLVPAAAQDPYSPTKKNTHGLKQD